MNITKKRQTHRSREETSSYNGERKEEKDSMGWRIKRYKLLDIKLTTRIYCKTQVI